MRKCAALILIFALFPNSAFAFQPLTTVPSDSGFQSAGGYILSKDANNTFDRSTDSLEAIRDRINEVMWGTTGSDTYYTTGNVGIGTTAPSSALQVVGTATATAFTDGTFSATGGAFTGVGSVTDGTASWSSNSLSGFTSISGTTITDGIFSATGGAFTGVGSVTDGTASWSSNSLSGFTSISGTTITDGTFSATGGAFTGVGSVTDGTASWSSNSLSGFTSISGTTITDGTFSVSAGAITGATTAAIGTSTTTPLIIGGTATTADLSLKTTSGVGATGADMHFLVGDNGATEAMTILNSGYVGIGTTAPLSKFYIEETSGDLVLWGRAATVSGQDSTLRLQAYSDATSRIELGDLDDADEGLILFDNSTGKMQFMDNGTDVNMVIQNTGNVGIGTTAPSGLLNIKGNLSSALTGTVAVTNLSTAVVGTTTVFTTELAVGDSIKIGTETFTVSVITDALNLTLDSAYQGVTASGLTAYKDPTLLKIDNGDGVNKVTVTKSGNVGIGTTTPGSKLHLSGGDFRITNTQSITSFPSGVANTAQLVYGTRGTQPNLDISLANGKGLRMTTENVLGTTDVFFQLIPATTDRNAWGILESWGLGGMAIGTGEAYPLTFYTNRARAMTILSGGNVGIGTTAPQGLLDVRGSLCLNGGADCRTTWPTAADTGYWTQTGSDLYYTGKIGIGTTAPTAQLHSKGTLTTALTGTVSVTISEAAVVGVGTAFTTELAVGDSIKIADEVFTVSAITDDTNLTLDSAHSAGASAVAAYTDPSLFAIDNGDAVNKVTVTKSGRVGIGTTAPSSDLDVSGTITAGTIDAGFTAGSVVFEGASGLTEDNANFFYGSGALKVGTSITSPLIIGGTATTADLSFKTTSGVGEAGADMHFLVGNNGATEAMTILNSGYVGIGTVAPVNALDIIGNRVKLTQNSDWVGFEFGEALTKYGGFYWRNALERMEIATTGYDYPILIQNSLFIDTDTSSGNVGIGTTDPGAKLQVIGTSQFGDATNKGGFDADGDLLFLGTADYLVASDDYAFRAAADEDAGIKFMATGGARLAIFDTTGAENVYFGAGGTAATRISYFGGAVGIGTTSPGALLDVGLAGTTLGVIRLEGSTSGYTAIQPNVVAGDTTLTLPAVTGTLLANVVEDTTPELGGELDAGAHSIGFTLQTATGDGTTTIDWTLGNKFKFTFGAQNDTFTFTAPTNPGSIQLILVQDGTGSRTATFPATVKWAGGTAPTLTTTAAGIDIVSCLWDGTNYFCTASLAFATP